MPLVLFSLLMLSAPTTLAQDDIRLKCEPRTFQVVPGEPIQLELTVQARTADPIRLQVPSNPQLKLRAVEKLPVRRTPKGVIIFKRVIIWQAVEPGTINIDAVSVQRKGRKTLFPKVTITVSDPGT